MGLARLVLAVQPLAHDLVPPPPRWAVGLGVIGRVLGEERPDVGWVIAVPCSDVVVDPGVHAAGVRIVHSLPPPRQLAVETAYLAVATLGLGLASLDA